MEKLQRISLYIFFFSLNFEVWDPFQTGGYFSIAKFTGIIYFLVSIPAIIKFRTTEINKSILNYILIFFCFLLFINMMHAESTKDAFFDFTILQNIILFWLLINHATKEPLILEKALLYFALGSATLAILYYNGIGIEMIEGRVSIFGDNENSIGQRMCFSIIIASMAVLQNRLHLHKSRFLLLLAIPLLFGLLVATGSRLSLVSLAVIFIASLVLLKTKNYFSKILIFAFGVIFFFFLFKFALENEVLRNRLLLSLLEGDLSGRDEIWRGITPLILENPIFGVGQTGYTSFCIHVFGRYWSPHNVILELLCFTGVFGFIIYSIFLYKIFKLGYLFYKDEGFLLPLLLAINIVGILLASHILEVKVGWVMLAYIATSYKAFCPQSINNSIYLPDSREQISPPISVME